MIAEDFREGDQIITFKDAADTIGLFGWLKKGFKATIVGRDELSGILLYRKTAYSVVFEDGPDAVINSTYGEPSKVLFFEDEMRLIFKKIDNDCSFAEQFELE